MSAIENVLDLYDKIPQGCATKGRDARAELAALRKVAEAAKKSKNMLGAHIGHDMTRDERKRMNHDVFDWLTAALKELDVRNE